MMNTEQPHIFTVAELNQLVREMLEKTFPNILVRGEISNLAHPRSGHMYFSLKDAKGQIRCAFFRGYQHCLNFQPKDGDQVTVCANLSLYPERGDYQLIVKSMEQDGQGALQQQFEALKQKLHAAGFFNEDHKKEIPYIPKNIGIITSDSGAALQDILSVLKRRFALSPITLYPTQVQGAAAANTIIAALKKANEDKKCDVLILTRGGGSLEDLWCFNDENLAHEIYKSEIPIISAVGHEIDFTIADFVADKRAPTPSAAAEIVVPDQADILNHIQHILSRLIQKISSHTYQQQQYLEQLTKRLKHPATQLQQQSQHLDFLYARLDKVIHNFLAGKNQHISDLYLRLSQNSPIERIYTLKQQFSILSERLQQNASHLLLKKGKKLGLLSEKLQVLSPLTTLSRGYSITQNASKKIITNAKDCSIGEKINLTLAKGKLDCKITATHLK